METFAFFKESQESGRLAQSADKLTIDELAFVVSVLAPFDELRAAQRRKVGRSEGDMTKLYASIAYDHGRLKRDEMNWPYDSYSLDTIKSQGRGICVDQAYYTATSVRRPAAFRPSS